MKIGWGERLRRSREQLGQRNRTTFPAQVGSNRTSWPKFEDEDVPPPFDVMIRVKELTGVSLDWIATGEEAPQAPINQDILAGVIEAVEQEAGDIDAKTKARLISRLYIDRIKHHGKGIEADSQPRGRTASKP